MRKLNLTIDLDNLTEKEREKFFKLVEKSKKKSFNPFERVEEGKRYYIIVANGEIEWCIENGLSCFYSNNNYYNNKEFAEHQALRELLNRKLIKFSYENGGADIENSDGITKIAYDCKSNKFYTNTNFLPEVLTPLFISEEVAQRAINEVIRPFMTEHPDFKWWG